MSEISIPGWVIERVKAQGRLGELEAASAAGGTAGVVAWLEREGLPWSPVVDYSEGDVAEGSRLQEPGRWARQRARRRRGRWRKG